MPSFNKFDFYQRAYAINQAIGTPSMATSSIKMGDTASYFGLAKRISGTLTTYDFVATEANYKLNNETQGGSPEYYTTKFSATPYDQQAGYLANTFVGKPVPKVNQSDVYQWGRTCYPSALGDIRDDARFSNSRDGAWVEAGYEPNGNRNTVNIYRTDVSGIIYFMATANVSVNSGSPAQTNSCRVFTSPGFITDNVSGLGGGGYPLVAFFAWDGTNTYLELFRWDFTNLTSVVSYNLTAINSSAYFEFPYSGKHDIFYLSKWVASQTYLPSDYLLIVAGGSTPGNVWQIDLSNGNLVSVQGHAANYSDNSEIILIAKNGGAGEFKTYISNINGSPVDTESVNDLNVFDIDYNWRLGVDYFFIGEDQQGLTPPEIKGWLIYIDGSAQFSSAYYTPPITYFGYGIYSYRNRPGGSVGALLNRVVAVDFGRIFVGAGPSLGTQSLISINCIDDQNFGPNSFYKAGAYCKLITGTENTDFVAMNHGFCEDWTGYFHGLGTYQTSGLNFDLPVGAGNQNILAVNTRMDVCAFQKNFFGIYHNSPTGGSYIDKYNYTIYLGQSSWDPAAGGNHTGTAWFYIAVTGGSNANDFLVPSSSPGTPVTFSAGTTNGKLQLLVFYA